MAVTQQTLTRHIAQLANNHEARRKFGLEKLNVQTVSWEDVGRSKNSCWGPNISDMTLQVGDHRLPVIRTPNYSDITVDLPIDKIMLTVGNEQPLEARFTSTEITRRISLRTYLENLPVYAKNQNIKMPMFLPERDQVLLASAQSCLLPLRDGSVPFHVALYNYQSEQDDPAILVILGTSQGTSCQVVDGKTKSLFFNDAGNSVELLAKRMEDDRKARGVPLTGPMTSDEKARNAIYLIQIPLKIKERPVREFGLSLAGYAAPSFGFGGGGGFGGGDLECASIEDCDEDEDGAGDIILKTASFGGGDALSMKPRGFDRAMIEKGTEIKGRYQGTRNLAIERDPRFSMRVTIQTYHVTDTIDIPDALIREIGQELRKIYSHGQNEGSLVTDGPTKRPTEHQVPVSSQPPAVFWD